MAVRSRMCLFCISIRNFGYWASVCNTCVWRGVRAARIRCHDSKLPVCVYWARTTLPQCRECKPALVQSSICMPHSHVHNIITTLVVLQCTTHSDEVRMICLHCCVISWLFV